jgi:hypothetical protein
MSPIRLIGFENDDAVQDMLAGFRVFADYKSSLSEHLSELIRKQNPTVELQSIELLEEPNLSFGGMPSTENPDHVIVDTIKAPFELKVRVATVSGDLHELTVTLVINAVNVNTTPQLTSDLFFRHQRRIS